MQAYPIGWLHPETDYIASFPPLNGLPTQYRITRARRAEMVRAVRLRGHLGDLALPGRTVRIDAPCLDCGDRSRRDAGWPAASRVDPPTVVGHLNYGFGPRAAARPISERA